MTAFAMFETPIGRCALVWRGEAIVGAALPDSSETRMRATLAARFPGAVEREPPEFAGTAIEAIRRLLSGKNEDFSSLAIDLNALSAFDRQVLEFTLTIPAGETRTYGEVANALGAPGAARAVGRALGNNPIPIIVPCHRVLAADGRSGGFSAPGGAVTKLKMLEIEGARRGSEPELFDRLPWRAKPAANPA